MRSKGETVTDCMCMGTAMGSGWVRSEAYMGGRWPCAEESGWAIAEEKAEPSADWNCWNCWGSIVADWALFLTLSIAGSGVLVAYAFARLGGLRPRERK